MKIIISHDVDHLSWGEHWLCDTYIPRYLLRHTRYLGRGAIAVELWRRRVAAPFRGKPLHHLDELLALDREHGVPATYFVGMRRGLRMSYNHAAARVVVEHLLKAGAGVGVHGISFDNAARMRGEREALQAMLPEGSVVGVRNHYLRRSRNTLSLQASAGYRFDSSEEAVHSPYIKHGICEFPVCLMESRLLGEDGLPGMVKARAETERLLSEAEQAGVSHFTILFHDIYFSPLFPLHCEWYTWLLPWLRQRYELTDFGPACRELAQN